MGNCPSISLVVRRIAPAWKTAWLASSETAASSTPSEERMRPSSRSARAGILASISPPSSFSELGPLDRQAIGVGRDHCHLRAAGGDEDAGQDRAMSSREAARATSSMLAPSSFAGSFRPGPRRARELREVLGGEDVQVEAGAAAADLHVRSDSRDSISTVGSASDRATSASSRPGSSTDPGDHVGGEGRLEPEVEVGGGKRHAALGGGEEDTGERLGRGAGRDGPGDDRELGDQVFAFGRELQVVDAFLSWVRSLWKRGSRRQSDRKAVSALWKRLWERPDSCSAIGRQPPSCAGLWIAPRRLWTRRSARVLGEAGFDAAQGVEHGGVISAAVEPPDLRQRDRSIAGEEDRDLACTQGGGGAAGADSSAREMPKLSATAAGSPRRRSPAPSARAGSPRQSARC